MATHEILDLDDPRLTVFRQLPELDRKRLAGRFVVEGRLLVERLLESDFEVESLLVDRRRLDGVPASAAEIPVYAVDRAALREIVGFRFHRGFLACGLRPSESGLSKLLPVMKVRSTIVICVDVHDPANLGGIIRSAAAFGADGVLVDRGCADPLSRRALRASMGAALRLPLASTDDLLADLAWLRHDHGFELFGAVLAGDAEPLHTVSRPRRLGLLIGNEGDGLAPDVVARCGRRLTIPMQGNTDSLNAVVACGVALYHFAYAGRGEGEPGGRQGRVPQ